MSDEDLAAKNVNPQEWKALSIRCLLKANAIAVKDSYFDWQTLIGEMLDDEIASFGFDPSFAFVKGKLKPQKRVGWDAPFVNLLPKTSGDCHKTAGMQVQTVHAVKGETHDITIFVCPPITAAHCPSTVWWSTGDKDREEKRIAYVAMTRTRGDLIFCVSQACYDRLAARRVAFVGSFECMTVADCVISLSRG